MFNTDILFTGFYGFQNTGDDAFVEVASWGAEKIWNKRNVRFLAKENNLPKTVIPSRAYPFKIPKTYQLQLNYLLRNTDYLISAGGSTIHSKMLESNPKLKAVNLKKSGKKIKIGGIGVSIGPFKSLQDERAVEEYLKSIDFLAVRDRATYEYISSLELPYQPVQAFDLAALLPEIYGSSTIDDIARKKKIIAISVCPYESLQKTMDIKKERLRNEMVIELIKQLDKKEDVHFKFYIINGNERIGDYKLTQETIKKANPRSYDVVNYNRETREVWESISMCDFVITTRLHAAIFACFSNTPFMLNEYHRKCSDFLEDVGYHEEYRLYNSEYSVNEKVTKILEIINNRHEYLQPVYLSKAKELARLNFTAISL